MLRIQKNVQESVPLAGELEVAFPHSAARLVCSTTSVLNPVLILRSTHIVPFLLGNLFLFWSIISTFIPPQTPPALKPLCFPLLSSYILFALDFDPGCLPFVPSSFFMEDGKIFKSV